MKILEKFLLVKEMVIQQALDAEPKEIQQINLTGNLHRAGRTRFYFIFEEAKETAFEFSQGTVKGL